jgi:hypothetical protein
MKTASKPGPMNMPQPVTAISISTLETIRLNYEY